MPAGELSLGGSARSASPCCGSGSAISGVEAPDPARIEADPVEALGQRRALSVTAIHSPACPGPPGLNSSEPIR